MTEFARFDAKMEQTFHEFTVEIPNNFKKELSTTLLSKIVTRTPVDTGRARGGWIVGIGNSSIREGSLDRSGIPTINRGSAVIDRANINDRIFISNKVPYIRRLERGHSRQAPRGFVALSIAELS